jgi:Tol biopolymer transport system component
MKAHYMLKIKAGITLLIFVLSFPSCIPEYGDPKPYNYIIDGPQDQHPAWSSDGEHIAYYHDSYQYPEPVNYPSGLYIINRDGSERRLVLAGHHFSPSWSPCGQWLVFSSGGIIQKCKIDGDSLTTFDGLNHLPAPEFYFPHWSGDGKYILFDKPLGQEWGVYYMIFDFNNPGRILSGRNPEMSPNMFNIAFSKGGHDVEATEIFLADTLGNNIVQLTKDSRSNLAPTWSPDGRYIAWSSSIRLCIMSADGTNQRQISYGNDPSWSVNDEIVFSHANSDYTKEVLYIIDPDGKNKRQITF